MTNATIHETHPTPPARLAIELSISEAIFKARDAKSAADMADALAMARRWIKPALDAAERLETAGALLRFADNYDGAPSEYGQTGPSYQPYALAKSVGLYLITGLVMETGYWWSEWKAQDRRISTTQVAWLRDQLLEVESALFEKAARLLACPQCAGSGFVAEPRTNGGQDAVEQECSTCSGRGCGDCKQEDDPRVIR